MNKLIIMLLVLLPLSQVAAQNTEYQAGIHYLEIANPIEVTANEGQSGEILVFFKYTCSACFQLHPFIEAWESKLDTGVVVKRVPVFQPEVYSKAYYAADLLNLDDGFHLDVYKKFHQERKPLRKMEEFAQLASSYGVDANRFLSTANSFAVDMKVNQGTKTAGQAQVPGTPFILVNGKYLLSGKLVGSNTRMLEVADYLLGKEALAGSE